MFVGFCRIKDDVTDFSAYQFFCLLYFTGKIFTVDTGTDQNEFYNMTVLSMGKVADKINSDQIADTVNDFLNYPVNTGLFHNYIMYITKERVAPVRLVNLFITVAEGIKQPCILKTVKFNTDSIWRVAEFRFESTEVGGSAAVKEEFLQQLDPGLWCYEGVYHQVR